MNEVPGQHDLLLESSNRKEAELHARFFCEHNDLVRYDSIIIDPDTILCGIDSEFFTKLKSGLKGNTKAINGLIEEFCAPKAHRSTGLVHSAAGLQHQAPAHGDSPVRRFFRH